MSAVSRNGRCFSGEKQQDEVIKMGKYFGTDGFRGEANENLTADHAYKVGRFLGWYYGELKRRNGDDTPARIIIGKDTRRSSYMFEYTLVGGLVASGADAYLLHVTTTPSVAYVARVDEFDCGIMISASHNPYFDNGIKLINGNGEKMDEETISLVEAYLDGNLEVFGQKWEEIPFAKKEKIGCTVDYVSGRNRYIGYLISLGVYSFRGVKVALDCANGSSWNIAKAVFDALGAKTYVINAQPDGTNINSNAGSTHIGGLQKYVVENGMDVGFAYDGDADRCLCVDEKGNVITGDHILYIYGKYMKERGKLLTNTVVTTVMSNFGLYILGASAALSAWFSRKEHHFTGAGIAGFVIGIFCILLSFFIFFQYMLVYEVARDPANADLIRQVYHQAQEILNRMGTTAQ